MGDHGAPLAPPQEEKGEKSVLPPNYADMFGWQELVAAVARVYKRLPPEDRSRCAIYASNYGEAGAIELFSEAIWPAQSDQRP